MADIEFNCPYCAQQLVVDEQGAGLDVPCPCCSRPIAIPERRLVTTAAKNHKRTHDSAQNMTDQFESQPAVLFWFIILSIQGCIAFVTGSSLFYLEVYGIGAPLLGLSTICLFQWLGNSRLSGVILRCATTALVVFIPYMITDKGGIFPFQTIAWIGLPLIGVGIVIALTAEGVRKVANMRSHTNLYLSRDPSFRNAVIVAASIAAVFSAGMWGLLGLMRNDPATMLSGGFNNAVPVIGNITLAVQITCAVIVLIQAIKAQKRQLAISAERVNAEHESQATVWGYAALGMFLMFAVLVRLGDPIPTRSRIINDARAFAGRSNVFVILPNASATIESTEVKGGFMGKEVTFKIKAEAKFFQGFPESTAAMTMTYKQGLYGYRLLGASW